ncbi:hypothetical protein PI124_g6977 [Phytophthora idaei]|nr:hypothetical protein PI126_g6855 [Phytophthora idaei]KAG3248350.1 hypothetical protein PI124_g6977 [Phytophthora idaei]
MTEKRRHDDRGVDGHRQQRPRPYNSREFSTSSSLSSRRFAVPRVHELSRQERVSFTQPHEIAYFSKYADEDVRFDWLNLLVYKQADVGTNLLDGVEEYTSKDESDPTAPPAPIAPLLAALKHFQRDMEDREKAHFVTYRNNLNKIMGTPYNSKNGWTLMLRSVPAACIWTCGGPRRTSTATAVHTRINAVELLLDVALRSTPLNQKQILRVTNSGK